MLTTLTRATPRPIERRQTPAVVVQEQCVLTQTQRPKAIDLFAGVGGLSLGAARAGFDVALAVELDDEAMAAHKRNFPSSAHLPRDVSTLNGADLLREAGLEAGQLDVLVGGPPCQGFSHIGQRDVVDPRNNLFGKFFELAAQCRPKVVVAENVLGILDEPYRPIREAAFAHLADGYIMLEPLRIKASDYGVPTVRERVFFIAYRDDLNITLSHADFEARRVETAPTVSDALRGLPRRVAPNRVVGVDCWRKVETLPESEFFNRVKGVIPDGVGDPYTLKRFQLHRMVSGCAGTIHSPEVTSRYHALQPGQKDQTSKSVRLRIDGLCPTLRAGTGKDKGSYQAVRPIHPMVPRVITPREAARLQGFPDWFRFAPTKWHAFRQIGNSVSPIVAEVVMDVIKGRLRN